MTRSGSFWDGVEGRTPMPPAARTLGFELIDAHPAAGTITVQFQGTAAFTNPFGQVLGGFLAAMLYDTLGPALLATLLAGWFIETLDLHCFFAAPARPGRFVGRGRVISRDGDLATLDGTLMDHTGTVVATATASAKVVPLDHRPAR